MVDGWWRWLRMGKHWQACGCWSPWARGAMGSGTGVLFYSFIYLFIYSYIHLFIYLFVYLFIYLFICFIYLFVYLIV